VYCASSNSPVAAAALAGKLDQARELSGLLLAAYPGDASVVMLQAVLLAKSGKVSHTRRATVRAAAAAAMCYRLEITTECTVAAALTAILHLLLHYLLPCPASSVQASLHAPALNV
jgi:hypothetical protein